MATGTRRRIQNQDSTEKLAIIFIGIPASGKSTFYHHNFSEKYEYINLDTLHTRNKEKSAVEFCLAEGKSFVVDNTNPTIADRQRYVPKAKTAGYRVECYFFQSVLGNCIVRNDKRQGNAKVPNVAIASISNKLEMPSKDEGFDAIYFVQIKDDSFIVEPWKEA